MTRGCRLALHCLLLLLPLAASASPELPRPASIEPRVRFWTRVYTEVGTDGGLIHDTENLGIVYEVIRFPSGTSERGKEQEKDRKKQRYRSLLRDLASGQRSGLSADQKRVLALFPDGVSNHTLARAAEQVRFQLGQADKFRAGLVRMGRWEGYIRQVLTERRLPTELIAIPHVESSYNPKAYSHAGAAGLWQFMRSTGKRFMRIDHLVDERLDPHLSSVAAARLLHENYQETGAWPLAITAYNHGAGGMKRATKQFGTRDIGVIVDRYQSRSFGFASRNFYCEFLAALDVERDPTRFFGAIAKDAPDDGEVVVLEHNYKASTLARTFGLSVDVLRERNPALLAPVWSGQRYVPRGHGLRVPSEANMPPARVALAAVPDTERFEEQPRDREYRVRRGDTLGRIARRYGVSETEIARFNRLPSRNHLRVGQRLEIPGPAASVASVSPPAAPDAPEPVAQEGVYRVQPGDTIGAISRRLGVSATDLMAANRLTDPRQLRAGRLLEIPGGSSTARPPAPGKPATSGVYTVRKGDTLHGIAQRFGVSAREIASLNGLRRPNQLKPGQILHVPAGDSSPPS